MAGYPAKPDIWPNPNVHRIFKVGRYGKQVIVNLVDQKKDEGRLEQSFKGFHQQV